MPLVACVELVKEDRMDKKRYWLVPSCHECKGILKDKIFPRMEQRKRYVKKRLRARYRKYLQVPQWDGHEIAELGDGLRAYVVQGEIKKHIIEDRLVWW